MIDVSEGSSVLLLGASSTHADHCCDTLLDVGEATNRAELSVRFPQDITDRTRLDTGTTGRQPEKRGEIIVGDVLRSADPTEPDFDAPVATDIVEDPTALTEIGSSVSEFCETWSSDGHRIVLCFDSISGLLVHSDPEVVFQFLHTLLGRLAETEAVTHFHIDPEERDEQLIATYSSLFDEIVDPENADALIDESKLEDRGATAEASLSDGIPATSGSSQASDSDIAARMDDDIEDAESSTSTETTKSGDAEATDDEIADRLDRLEDDDAGE